MFSSVAVIAGDFTDNGDGTVTDANTGLMWQQGEVESMIWEDAIACCESLSLAGYDDWRLPNIRELESITDDVLLNPAINTEYFPNAYAYSYLSSTSYSEFPSGSVWGVDFCCCSYVHPDHGKSYDYHVRCVRAGK